MMLIFFLIPAVPSELEDLFLFIRMKINKNKKEKM